MISDNERQRLQQQIAEFWIGYYSELRKELPKYVSDLESKQIPVCYRRHRRYIRAMEFDDGYVIVQRTVPEEEFDQVGHWETFYFVDYRGQTVGAATGRGYPPYGDFVEGEMPMVWEVKSGEFSDPMPPESIDSRDYISHNRITSMYTEEGARELARKHLREFFT